MNKFIRFLRVIYMARKKEEVAGGVFKVYDKQGKFIREYTEEIHGEDAEKLANQFAGNNDYEVK